MLPLLVLTGGYVPTVYVSTNRTITTWDSVIVRAPKKSPWASANTRYSTTLKLRRIVSVDHFKQSINGLSRKLENIYSNNIQMTVLTVRHFYGKFARLLAWNLPGLELAFVASNRVILE
jgi:hypothetical protein